MVRLIHYYYILWFWVGSLSSCSPFCVGFNSKATHGSMRTFLHFFLFICFIIQTSWWKSIYQNEPKNNSECKETSYCHLSRWWSSYSSLFFLVLIRYDKRAKRFGKIFHVLFDKYRFTQQWETIHVDQTSEMKQIPCLAALYRALFTIHKDRRHRIE